MYTHDHLENVTVCARSLRDGASAVRGIQELFKPKMTAAPYMDGTVLKWVEMPLTLSPFHNPLTDFSVNVDNHNEQAVLREDMNIDPSRNFRGHHPNSQLINSDTFPKPPRRKHRVSTTTTLTEPF